MAAEVSFSIESITATPLVPIANHDESVSLLPGITSSLWTPESAETVKDSRDGSSNPLGLVLGQEYHIQVKGKIPYPIDWPEAEKGNTVLRGCLRSKNNTSVEVLKGTWRQLGLDVPPVRQGVLLLPFDCTVVFSGPFVKNGLPKIPFGFRGDIEWSVERDTQIPVKSIPAGSPTRLEIYQVAGAAPGGPTEAIDWSAVRLNLQGKWPIKLLRSFVPNPFDIDGNSAEIQANQFSWWALHSIKRIQSQGSPYDAAEGRSGYGMGLMGGSLDLDGWYDAWVDGSNQPAVNSFDITGLLEASFTLLPPFNLQRLPSPIWVGLTPAGLIAAQTDFTMIPLGWLTDETLGPTGGVANPFYKGIGKIPGGEKILSASWLEIQTTTDIKHPAYIVQGAFNTKAKTEKNLRSDVADITRASFLQRHFSEWATLENNADVFYTSDKFLPISPASDLDNGLYQKVGLYNLRGINEPWAWSYKTVKPSALPMPPTMRMLIRKLMGEKDKVNKSTAMDRARRINAGSLKPARILPLLTDAPSPILYKQQAGDFRLVVGRGISVANYALPLDKTAFPGVNLRIKISTFYSFSGAFDALISALSSFESDLEKVVRPNDPSKTYGNYMVQTTQSLFLVRNNLFIDFEIAGVQTYGDPAVQAVLGIAGKLDAYLASSSVDPCQVRKVGFQIRPYPQEVTLNQVFDITLANVDYIAQELGVHIAAGTSIVEQPIICTSTGKAAADTALKEYVRKLSFLPVRKDPSGLALDVDIHVSAAHYDTFYPITKSIKVTTKSGSIS